MKGAAVAVGPGTLSVKRAYEIYRVAPAHRPAIFAALKEGKGKSAIRALAKSLAA